MLKIKSKSQSSELPKRNNFDLLRFVFAFMVFAVHAYTLSGEVSLAWLAEMLSSELAVQCFFVVSGFLIFMSYERSTGLRQYFEKRLRRIYPAYLVVVLLCGLLGIFLTVWPIADYLRSDELQKYLVANFLFLNFLQPGLPGVFGANPISAVNGALWTLKIEVMFYGSVPVMVWFLNKAGKLKGLVILYVASLSYAAMMMFFARSGGSLFIELQRQLPGQLMYFVVGAGLYFYYDQFKLWANKVLICAVLGLALDAWLGLAVFHAAAVGVIVIYCACVLPFLGDFGKYGDFSYGVYILHFPIIQSLVALGWFDNQPWLGFALAACVTLSLSFLLWHGVEKPFLKDGSYYVGASHD